MNKLTIILILKYTFVNKELFLKLSSLIFNVYFGSIPNKFYPKNY